MKNVNWLSFFQRTDTLEEKEMLDLEVVDMIEID